MKFKNKFFSFSALVVGFVPLVAVSCNNGTKTTDGTKTKDDTKKEPTIPKEVKALTDKLQEFNYTGLTENEFKALKFDNVAVKSVDFEEKVMAIFPEDILSPLYALNSYEITASKKANENKVTYTYKKGDDVYTSETMYTSMISDADKTQIDTWKNDVKTLKGTWRPWGDWQTRAATAQGIKIGDKFQTVIADGVESIDGNSRNRVGLKIDTILAIKAKTKDVKVGKYQNTYLIKASGSATIKYALGIDLENGGRILADVEVPYAEANCPNPSELGDVLQNISYVYKTDLTAADFKAKTFDANVQWTTAANATSMNANYGSGGELKLNILHEGNLRLPLKKDLGNGNKAALRIKKDANSTIVFYVLTYNAEGSNDTKTVVIKIEVTQFGQ